MADSLLETIQELRVMWLSRRAGAALRRGYAPRAETLFRRAASIMERTYGDAHPTDLYLTSLVTALLAQGKVEEAEPHARRALAIAETEVTSDRHSEYRIMPIAGAADNLCRVLNATNRKEEALQLEERIKATYRRAD